MKGIITKQVLLLNADMTVLTTISTKRAIRLYMLHKIVPLKLRDERKFHPTLDIGYPSIVMMKSFVKVPRRKIPLTRKNILIRDSYTCQYTGQALNEKNSSIDHVIPKSHKNSPGNTWRNLVACSKKINNVKDNKTPEEAGLKLIREPFEPKWDELILKSKFEWKNYFDEIKVNNL